MEATPADHNLEISFLYIVQRKSGHLRLDHDDADC